MQARKILFTILMAIVIIGCENTEKKTSVEVSTSEQSQGTQQQATSHAKGSARRAPRTIDRRKMEASASLLNVDLKAWKAEAPQGNFATLSVEGEDGKQEVLSIERLEVSVQIEGRMARTTVTQVFRNHLSRQTEGTYEFSLPGDVAISGLAMDVNGVMVEGELVERERARLIYESIVRKQKDPALLEWQGGDRFQTQIFPIPANGTKTVLLSYETLLPESRDGIRYEYSLPKFEGDTKGTSIKYFNFKMDVDGQRPFEILGYEATISPKDHGTQASFTRSDFISSGPIQAVFNTRKAGEEKLRMGQEKIDGLTQYFFSLDFIPEIPPLKDKGIQNLVVAIDTSAGLGSHVVDQSRLAALMLFDEMPAEASFQLVYGDFIAQTCQSTPFKKADRTALSACLNKINAGGASNLSALLEESTRAAKLMKGDTSIVFFSDGISSIGELDGDLLRARAAKHLNSQNIALHTVAVGHSAASSDLLELARASKGHSFRMTPSQLPDQLVAQLIERTQEPLLIDVTATLLEGDVEHLSPNIPSNLARGEAITLMGRLRSPSAKIKITGKWTDFEVSRVIDISAPKNAKEGALLSNFWARSAIQKMDAKGIHRGEISKFSVNYGVMSKYTSFLVLENDQAYKEFEIERRREAERLAQLDNQNGYGIFGDGESKSEEEEFESDKATEGKKEVKNLKKSGEDLKSVLEKETARRTQAAPKMEMAAPKKKSKSSSGKDSRRGRGAKRSPAPSSGSQQGFVLDSESTVSVDFGGLTATGRLSGAGGGGAEDPSGGVIGGLRSKRDFGKSKPIIQPRKPSRISPQEEPVAVVKKPSGPLSLSEMITDFESRKNTLSPYESGRLLALYIEDGRDEDAEKFFKAQMASFEKSGMQPSQIAQIFRDYRVKTHFSEGYLSMQRALAKTGDPQALENIFQQHFNQKSWTELVEDLGAYPVTESYTVQGWINRLTNAGQKETARDLLKRFGRSMPTKQYLNLISSSSFASEMEGEQYMLTTRMLKDKPGNLSALQLNITLAQRLGKQDEALLRLESSCIESPMPISVCRSLLERFGEDPKAGSIREGLAQNRLKNMQRIRAQDVANPELIKEFSDLLRESKKTAEADRLLSEIVEFAPHDYEMRVKYAEALKKLKQPVQACETYAAAVQLNPARRDTFRTMMRIRRDFEGESQKLRECIVQGVSNLPVTRDVSLVLTWEDPSADVDLHIHEAAGEHIDFTRRESKQGGLLYYDITDGYGPEIYVLGNGAKGDYLLNLVYYRGSQRNLKGTLTVLRNAGAINEKRESFDFTLPKSDNTKEIPVTVLKL